MDEEVDAEHSNPRVLTGSACASLLRDLEQVLLSAGISIQEMKLWDDLLDLRWLANQDGPVLIPNPPPDERQRRLLGFRDAVLIKRSVQALERTRQYHGWQTAAGHLRYWRTRDPDGEKEDDLAQGSLNHLYEIEVAARFGVKFSKVRFAEPDLVIDDPESKGSWTIACKRPRSGKTLLQNVRKAAKQIGKDGRLGLVMISIDRLVDQFVVDLTGESLEPECHKRQDNALNPYSDGMLRAIRPYPPSVMGVDTISGSGVLGILSSATFVLLGKDGTNGPVFLSTRTEPVMTNRNDPEWARKGVFLLLNFFKFGDQELKSKY